MFLRGQKIDEKLIEQVTGFASEERQLRFLASRRWALEVTLGHLTLPLAQDMSARRDALDLWIRRKGVVLEAQRRFQEALVYSDDPKAVSASQELARIRARLSQMVFGGPGKEGPEAFRKRISQLEARKAELEAVLMGLSRAYALRKKVRRADSAMVAQALPEKTALLEFARIHHFNFKAKPGEPMWFPPRYIAFVLHAGKGDKLELVDLGDAGEIDGAIALFKKELSGKGGVYSPKAAETSRRLHDTVFEPLRKGLGEVREVFISPDGNLNLLPFEVLQGPDGRFLPGLCGKN